MKDHTPEEHHGDKHLESDCANERDHGEHHQNGAEGVVVIDGSHGEGGGAILRTALALSTITGKPFRIVNIRSGRPQPGVKREHLSCIRILQEVAGAKVEGAFLGSESILFIPGVVKRKTISYDLETAASTTLVAQCLILATMFSGKRVKFILTGGTDVKWSIPADYLLNVFVPALAPLGDVTVRILQRGYYPKGDGKLEVVVRGRLEKSKLPRLSFTERGQLLAIGGVAHAATELADARVAERMRDTLNLSLPHARIRAEYAPTASPGAGVTLWARYEHTVLGASMLGERGVPAENVAASAAKELMELMRSDAVVDSFLADQLVPYLSLCGGKLRTRKITQHALSNVSVCEQFLNTHFQVGENVISCVKRNGREEWRKKRQEEELEDEKNEREKKRGEN